MTPENVNTEQVESVELTKNEPELKEPVFEFILTQRAKYVRSVRRKAKRHLTPDANQALVAEAEKAITQLMVF
jgi:hypothetical protein